MEAIRFSFAKIGNIFKKIGRFILFILDDLLILAGLGVIVYTNFRVNEIIGLYSLGAALLAMGLVYAIASRRRG